MSGEEAKQPEVAQEASAEPMEQEAAPAAAGTKRKAEEDPAAEGGEQPAAKAAKTGGAEAGEAAAEAGEAAEDAGGEAAAEEGGPATETSAPVQIGYKTFNSGKEAKAYYHNLISKLRKYQNLNDVSAVGGSHQLQLCLSRPSCAVSAAAPCCFFCALSLARIVRLKAAASDWLCLPSERDYAALAGRAVCWPRPLCLAARPSTLPHHEARRF